MTTFVVLLSLAFAQVEEQPAIPVPGRIIFGRLPIVRQPAVPPALANDADDEALLSGVNLPTDALSLTTFLRKQKVNESDSPRIAVLVGKLGDDDFDVRQEATEELIRFGPSAVPALKESLKTRDLEVLRRTETCLKAIDSVSGPLYQEAVVRLLARKAPAQAVTVLLEVIGDLRGASIVDAVAQSLARAGVTNGKPSPALVQALADRLSVKREVAGEAIARAGDADARKTVAALLNDPDVLVRLRVAAALFDRGEAETLPVLIKLLQDAPLDRVYEVEGLLLSVAGEKAPELSLGKTADTRKAAAAAWQAWYDRIGQKVNLAKLAEERAKPGSMVLSMMGAIGVPAGLKSKIMEIDAAGKTVWEFEVPNYAYSAQKLPRDRVLISEYSTRKVSERTIKGDVIWTKDLTTFPNEAVRLPSGNTLISLRTQLLEVDGEGKDVRTINRAAGDILYAMTPMRNGEIGAITSTNRFVRMDAEGKELSSFALSGRPYTSGSHFAISPNGTRITVPIYYNIVPGGIAIAGNQGRVIEYDNDGKTLWETEVDRPTCVRRMTNGNVLVSSRFHSNILELDSRGKVVNKYEAPAAGRVLDAQR